MTQRLRILVVCTGNICRSPAAQALLAHRLGEQGVVTSAGTRAPVGRPVSPEIAELLAHRGIDVSQHRARALTPAEVETADLVLTATRRHRSAVVELAPRALRRSFTLLELARLAPELIDHEPGADLIAAAATLRGPLADPGIDDIPDPYGRSWEHYEAAVESVDTATATIASLLGR